MACTSTDEKLLLFRNLMGSLDEEGYLKGVVSLADYKKIIFYIEMDLVDPICNRDIFLDVLTVLIKNTVHSIYIDVINILKKHQLQQTLADYVMLLLSHHVKDIILSTSHDITDLTSLYRALQSYDLERFSTALSESFQDDAEKLVYKSFLLTQLVPYAFNLLDDGDRPQLIAIDLALTFSSVPIITLTTEEADKFLNNLDNYLFITRKLWKSSFEGWPKLWMIIVKLLDLRMHNIPNLSKNILKIVEDCFKSENIQQIIRGLDCWKILIDSCSLDNKYFIHNKRINLLLTPLMSTFGKHDALTVKRFEVFKHLLMSLQNQAELVLREFFIFCFGKCGKDIPELHIHFAKVLLAILGHSHEYVGNCLETSTEIHLERGLLESRNISHLFKALIYSVVECCKFLKQTQLDETLRNKVLRCLCDSLINILLQDYKHLDNVGVRIGITLNYLIRHNDQYCCNLSAIIFNAVVSHNDKQKVAHIVLNQITHFVKVVFTVSSCTDSANELRQFIEILGRLNRPTVRPAFVKQIYECFSEYKTVDVNADSVARIWLLLSEHINDSAGVELLSYLIWPVQYFCDIRTPEVKKIMFEQYKHKLVPSVVAKSDPLRVKLLEHFKTYSMNDMDQLKIILNIITWLTAKTNNEEIFGNTLDTINSILLATNPSANRDSLASYIKKFYESYVSVIQDEDTMQKLYSCIKDLLKLNNFEILSSVETFLKKSPDSIIQIHNKFLTIDFLTCLSLDHRDNIYAVQAISKVLQLFLDAKDPAKKKFVKIISPSAGRSARIVSLVTQTPDEFPLKLFGKGIKSVETTPNKSNLKEQKNYKPSIDDESSEKFVFIDTTVSICKDKLTERQKEKLKKRRDDIPALYQELSQNISQSSDSTSNNSTVVAKVDDGTKHFDLKIVSKDNAAQQMGTLGSNLKKNTNIEAVNESSTSTNTTKTGENIHEISDQSATNGKNRRKNKPIKINIGKNKPYTRTNSKGQIGNTKAANETDATCKKNTDGNSSTQSEDGIKSKLLTLRRRSVSVILSGNTSKSQNSPKKRIPTRKSAQCTSDKKTKNSPNDDDDDIIESSQDSNTTISHKLACTKKLLHVDLKRDNISPKGKIMPKKRGRPTGSPSKKIGTPPSSTKKKVGRPSKDTPVTRSSCSKNIDENQISKASVSLTKDKETVQRITKISTQMEKGPEDTAQTQDTQTQETVLSGAELTAIQFKLDLPKKRILTESEEVISRMDTASMPLDSNLLMDYNEFAIDLPQSADEMEFDIGNDSDEDRNIVSEKNALLTESKQTASTQSCATPTPESLQLANSPETKETSNRTFELLNDTSDISPIESPMNHGSPSDDEFVEDIGVNFDAEFEFEDDPMKSQNNASQNATEPLPVTHIAVEEAPLESSQKDKGETKTLAQRGWIFNRFGAGSGTIRLSGRPKTILFSSSRVQKLMSNIQPVSSPPDDIAEQQEQERVLTFDRPVPSPLALPRSSILKRKYADSPEDESVVAKRKRVNFSDPCTTSKKVFITEQPETSQNLETLGEQPETSQNLETLGEQPETSQNLETLGEQPETSQNLETLGEQPETSQNLETLEDDINNQSLEVSRVNQTRMTQTETVSVATESNLQVSKSSTYCGCLPIYSKLSDCYDNVSVITTHLTGAMSIEQVLCVLSSNKIHTIRDLAMQSESGISGLQFTVSDVYNALDDYYYKNFQVEKVVGEEWDQKFTLELPEIHIKDENEEEINQDEINQDEINQDEINQDLEESKDMTIETLMDNCLTKGYLQNLSSERRLDLFKQGRMEELETAIWENVQSGVYDRNYFLETCIFPYIEPIEWTQHFIHLTMLEANTSVLKRIHDESYEAFISKILVNSTEQCKIRILDLFSLSQLTESMIQRATHQEIVTAISGLFLRSNASQEDLMQMFRLVTENLLAELPPSLIWELGIILLQSVRVRDNLGDN